MQSTTEWDTFNSKLDLSKLKSVTFKSASNLKLVLFQVWTNSWSKLSKLISINSTRDRCNSSHRFTNNSRCRRAEWTFLAQRGLLKMLFLARIMRLIAIIWSMLNNSPKQLRWLWITLNILIRHISSHLCKIKQYNQ